MRHSRSSFWFSSAWLAPELLGHKKKKGVSKHVHSIFPSPCELLQPPLPSPQRLWFQFCSDATHPACCSPFQLQRERQPFKDLLRSSPNLDMSVLGNWEAGGGASLESR